MMEGFLGAAWLWVKAAHIIFVIFWMAGMFMLPRFFIYHQQTAPGSAEDRAWVERETRLRNIILSPTIGIVWILGLVLAANAGAFTQGWFHAKLAIVFAFSGYHGWMVGYSKKLARGERKLSDKALRMANEIPGIVTALVVILAVVRPF